MRRYHRLITKSVYYFRLSLFLLSWPWCEEAEILSGEFRFWSVLNETIACPYSIFITLYNAKCNKTRKQSKAECRNLVTKCKNTTCMMEDDHRLPCKSQYPHTNSSESSPYISLKNKLRESVERSRDFSLEDHFLILVTFLLDCVSILFGEI